MVSVSEIVAVVGPELVSACGRAEIGGESLQNAAYILQRAGKFTSTKAKSSSGQLYFLWDHISVVL